MSKTSEIIETDLAPHIDIHDPAIIVGLNKLINAVRDDSAKIAEESFYMDQYGSSPMDPDRIAKRIRAGGDRAEDFLTKSHVITNENMGEVLDSLLDE